MGYYDELSRFYQATAVNLNVTSAQMPTGLNQRVFDVPASRAFLLTDRQGQLEGLFEPDREVATYASPEEARDKALWHLANPAGRAKVAEKAHRRVLAHHQYRHRLSEMLRSMGLGAGLGKAAAA